MVETLVESPLASHAKELAQASVPGKLELGELGVRSQVNLRVDPKSPAAERIGTALGAALPNQSSEVVRVGGRTVLWLGPDEWLILGTDGDQDEIQQSVLAAANGEHVGVTDVSGHRAIIEVTGTSAPELLNKGCALDLHPSRFHADCCAGTMLARAQVILVCRDTAPPSFWLLVRSSFARYLADWLLDAAAEYER